LKKLLKDRLDCRVDGDERVTIKKRNIVLVYILAIITLGIYGIYWLYSTKKEMNEELGANIPTTILIIIPIANLYWMYRYAEAFATKVKKDDNTVLWALLFILISIITPAIVQTELNKLADNPNLLQTEKQKRQNKDRRCPNCGRDIPFDARTSPYCGKKFEE